MKHRNAWFVVCAIASTCAIGWTVSPQEASNLPAVFPDTSQPTPVVNTNQISQTSTNSSLPPAYQGGIGNLHDKIGTNAVNHGNDNPTLTNHPNQEMQLP
jgi:hypothetical protein